MFALTHYFALTIMFIYWFLLCITPGACELPVAAGSCAPDCTDECSNDVTLSLTLGQPCWALQSCPPVTAVVGLVDGAPSRRWLSGHRTLGDWHRRHGLSHPVNTNCQITISATHTFLMMSSRGHILDTLHLHLKPIHADRENTLLLNN